MKEPLYTLADHRQRVVSRLTTTRELIDSLSGDGTKFLPELEQLKAELLKCPDGALSALVIRASDLESRVVTWCCS